MSGSSRTMIPRSSQDKETFTVSVVNVSGDPVENTHVFLAGGHVDPIVFILDEKITDANGECQFSAEPGTYTLYLIGPDINGSVLNLGQIGQSVYLPNIRFITLVNGADNNQSFTLIKKPKYWPAGQQQALLTLE